MKWIAALKEFAKTNGKYVVPKKGTAEYDAVRKIMGASGAASAPAPAVEMKAEGASKPVRKRVAKAAPGTAGAESLSAVPAAAPKAKAKAPANRAHRSKKVKIEESNTADSRPLLGLGREKAGSVEVGGAFIPEGVTKLAGMRSKNPAAILESAANSHIAIASPENYVKLKPVKNLKREMAEVNHPEVPSLVVPHKVTNSNPFSFQNLRNHLGA
jgi:hypothetical protein